MATKRNELPEGAWEICEKFDINKDGFISKKEIKQATGMNEADIDDLVRNADVNKDGKVNYKEFFTYAFKKD